VITHFEATIALLSACIGMLGALIAAVWKARGWVDRLNATDGRLADAIEGLTQVQQQQHRENLARFNVIEGRLGGPRRGRA
jgi:hypothetical protein